METDRVSKIKVGDVIKGIVKNITDLIDKFGDIEIAVKSPKE